MADAMKTLLERRSVRNYDGRIPDEATLDQILEAGLYAPSAMGRQGAILVAVRDPALVSRLSKMNAAVMGSDSDPFYGAKCCVIVLCDLDVSYLPVQDGSLAMGNLLNAAHAMGVSSCWINRAQEMFETSEGKDLLASWGLNGRYQGVGICILGYGAQPVAAPRKANRIVKV